MLEAAIFVVFPFCMAFAAVSDMVSMTIANRVSLILIAAFAVIAPLTGMEWATYGWHFAAGGTVLLVTFSLFALGAIGGGDAKLLAATALWMGVSPALIEYFVMSGMVGGALTVAILLFRKSTFAVFSHQNVFLRHLADDSVGIPYGIALGISGLLVFPKTELALWALAQIARY